MSRSGYNEGDCDSNYLYLYRGMVERSLAGKRGQMFLRELAKEMDAMPAKRLITSELIAESGEVCAIGVVCKARGLDVSKIDVYEPDQVGGLVGISRSMAAEIEYENDEGGRCTETPEDRWERIRAWVAEQLKDPSQ